jgi:hypothetical protein
VNTIFFFFFFFLKDNGPSIDLSLVATEVTSYFASQKPIYENVHEERTHKNEKSSPLLDIVVFLPSGAQSQPKRARAPGSLQT